MTRRRPSKSSKRVAQHETKKAMEEVEDKVEDLVIPETIEACLRSLDRELCCSIW
jgi:hypothetical protein